MTGRTHDLAALASLAGIVFIAAPISHATLSTTLAAVLANQIGGIAPDIDQPTAPLWRNLPIGGLVGKIISKTLGGHRFLSHSLLGLALFGFLAQLLLAFLQPIMPHIATVLVWWAFMIGFLSHLIMDSLTKEGVPWLLPIPYKFGLPPLRRLRITTGSFVEVGLILPLLIAAIIWLFAHYSRMLPNFAGSLYFFVG